MHIHIDTPCSGSSKKNPRIIQSGSFSGFITSTRKRGKKSVTNNATVYADTCTNNTFVLRCVSPVVCERGRNREFEFDCERKRYKRNKRGREFAFAFELEFAFEFTLLLIVDDR